MSHSSGTCGEGRTGIKIWSSLKVTGVVFRLVKGSKVFSSTDETKNGSLKRSVFGLVIGKQGAHAQVFPQSCREETFFAISYFLEHKGLCVGGFFFSPRFTNI